MKKLIYFLLVFTVILQSCSYDTDNRTAQEVVQSVANKIIRETAFELKDVAQKPVLNLQLLDYRNQYNSKSNGLFYSMSYLTVKSDTTLEYGFDYKGAVKIFVNGKQIYEGTNYNKVKLREIAYNMFVWRQKISMALVKDKNTILIKMVPVDAVPVFFMREIANTAESPLSGTFAIGRFGNNEIEADWVSVGEFAPAASVKESLSNIYPPEIEIKDEYQYQGESYKWTLPKANRLKELVINKNNSYQRESYAEWHYANGTTLMGMLAAGDALNDNTYSVFVSKVCSMNVANKKIFKNQFDEYYAIRGTNNRMFRKTMLDDTGGPALPYLQTFLNTKNEMLKPVIDEMSNYVMNDQARLKDGTFCRPEPVEMTIWADDLFMSVPFLVRMGKLTGDQSYYDDAARQIINFKKYLFDEKAGLFNHGLFVPTNENSIVYWGRANGWIVWATSEALLHLPKDHSAYVEIQNIFKSHIEGLLTYQDESGMWHQVLDKPESFKETSCTAMFILGIVRGVMHGWLDESYKENAIRAWNEMKNNINDEGTVKDICRGTGIGFDFNFYFNRNRFDNDPRGLGAVLTALVEIQKLMDSNH
jgi:rhamnogalacturonyl hydrolase YesR